MLRPAQAKLEAKLEAKLDWQSEMGQSCKRALRVKPRAISYWQPQGMRIAESGAKEPLIRFEEASRPEIKSHPSGGKKPI